jgi:hypothetical protein
MYVIAAILIVLGLGAAELMGDDRAADLEVRTDKPRARAADAAARLPRPLPQSRGATRHIAPSGHDAAPGTLDRPWRTIQKALDALRPGERALVRAGTYTDDHVARRGGSARAPITIAAYPGEKVVLHAASASGDTYPIRFTDAAAYIRLQGFTIERAHGISSTNVYFEGNVHDIELSGNDIRFSQDQGVFSERTTRRLHIVGNRIHDNGLGHRPGQHQSHGLYIEGRDHLIANNVIHDHRFGFGIQLYPANAGTMVVNNTIAGSAHSGIVVGGADGVSDIVIRNNIVAGNAKYGIEMESSCPTRTIVDTNVVHANRSGGVDEGCSGVDLRRGNIEADPRFVSGMTDDYRLRPGSPAIDRGLAAYAPRLDVRGARRPLGRGYDAGAYERAP